MDVNEILPLVPSEVTAAWLGSKLGHRIKTLTNPRNIFGTASKLFFEIEYAEPAPEGVGRPLHICVKGVFDPAMVTNQPWTISLAQREADFFEKLAPRVKHMTYPNSWWAGSDDKQGIVVMNDLTTEGCTFAPEVASYGVDVVLDGVQQLAGYHAMHWGQSQDDHPWIWNNYDPAMTFMCRQWNTLIKLPGRGPLPPYLMDGDRCNDAVDRYYAHRNPRFRTLLHGDTHIGNIYFTADKHVGFIDWSAIHFGSCFHDIVYFMTALMTVEGRREHEMRILDYYLEALHRFGGPKFNRHNDPDVMIEYRRSFMTNVIWIICPPGLQSEERVAMLCERTVAAFDDHKVVDLLMSQPPAPKPAT